MGCGGFTCSKNALAALNVLYILVAFILIGVAAYGKAVAVITNISIMSGIIACGVFLLIIAFIGLIGAIKHHQVLLFFYMIILFLIFLVQFAVACACLAVNEEQQKTLATAGWNSTKSMAVKSEVQKFFQCCGFDTPDDQDNVYIGNHTNDSMSHYPCGQTRDEAGVIFDELICCHGVDAYCCTGAKNYTVDKCPCDPCWEDHIGEHMDQALKISGGIGLFFSFTEIFGVWITVRFRNQKDPRANPSAFL